MSDEPQGLSMAEAGSAPAGAPDLDLPIEDLEHELLAITNFGQKSLDEVNEKLDERGLALAGPRS